MIEAIRKSMTASEVPNHFIVRESKIIQVVLIFLFLLLLIILIIDSNESIVEFLLSIGICFTIIGCLLYSTYVRIVSVSNRTIQYNRVLEKGNFSIDEISKVRFGIGNALIVYCGEKRMFAVEPNCHGYYDLLTRLIFEGAYFDNLPKL